MVTMKHHHLRGPEETVCDLPPLVPAERASRRPPTCLRDDTAPHSWKARWLDWSQTRTDKSGRIRPMQRSFVLGYKTAKDLPTKSAAEDKWAKVRSSKLANNRSGNNPAPTFAEFVQVTFVPGRNALRPWRPRSREKFDYLMSKAFPAFGEKDLGAITSVELQHFLVDIAKKYCHDTASGQMMYLRAIFNAAVDEDLVLKSPARKLVLPATRDRSRPCLTLDQIGQLEAKLTGQDRIILQLLSRCGLRAGEAFGLQGQDVNPDRTLSIQRTFSKGEVGPPKTKTGNKRVALPKPLYDGLTALLEETEDQSPASWLFPSSRKRGKDRMPVDPGNWLKRVLQPAAEELGFAL
jgi:integrase